MLRSVFAFTIDNEVADRLDYGIYPEIEKAFTMAILRLTLWGISAKKDAYAFGDDMFSLVLL
ncbi:hypothetical protein PAEAM_18900 [Paenibacillus sp. GM1FR]|nr:hypothetical protein PAEAM_18900 [Paenibacillus sp. GM1FR]